MEHFVTDPEQADVRPRRRMRRRTKWVLAAAVVLLVPIGLVTGYGVYLSHVVSSNIHHDNLLPPSIPGGPVPADGPSAGAAAAAAPQPVQGKGLNVLLVGSNAGPGRVGGRSDVIMLLHIPEGRSKVQLVHFPRDLYVSIPGHGMDKITRRTPTAARRCLSRRCRP